MSSPSSRRLARLLAASPGALARPRAFGASSLAPAPSGSPPGSSARARAVDVCVVGGGVVGTALACALKASPRTAHLSVLLADRSPAPPPAFLDAPRRGVDARVSTVTPSSAAFLRSLGAWDRVANTRRARAFDAMQVWDASFPGHVRYDAAELGELELGWVVENRVVQAALAERAAELGVETAAGWRLEAFRDGADRDGALAEVDFATEGEAAAKGPTNPDSSSSPSSSAALITTVRASLVVGADGASSRVRELARLRASGWGYGQKAAVGTVACAGAFPPVAFQRFLPTGPVALLPVGEPDAATANVVWSTTPEEADRLVGLSDEAFAREVHDAFHSHRFQDEKNFASDRGGGFEDGFRAAREAFAATALRPLTEALGAFGADAHRRGGLGGAVGLLGGAAFEPPPAIVGASSARGAFPLRFQRAGSAIATRMALVGDALGTVHPLGGQGQNLGLRDAKTLASALGDACAAGGDVGGAGALRKYADEAFRRNAPMAVGLDALARLFGSDAPEIKWARAFGLAGVNTVGGVRRSIARYAMGDGEWGVGRW